MRKVFTSPPPIGGQVRGGFGGRRATGQAKPATEVVALNGLTLEVHPGEIFGLLGPNGAGKSTTVGVLTTRVRPTAGRAWIGDFNVWEQRVQVKRLIGVVPRTRRLQTLVQSPISRYIRRFVLLLNLNKIRTAQERFEQVYQPEAFAADPDSFRVAAPVALAFDMFKDTDQFRLAGTVKTTLELMCSRCLEPFMWAADAAFDLRYHPHAASADGEKEIEEDDLTTAFYENDTIDLGHLMHEQFLLSMPMKPLCSDACHGLCPLCGTNLNRATCGCTREWEDPRLAVLRNVKLKS